MNRLIRNCLGLMTVLLAIGDVHAQVAVNIQYVTDIDDWRVEVYAGADNADGFVQGGDHWGLHLRTR